MDGRSHGFDGCDGSATLLPTLIGLSVTIRPIRQIRGSSRFYPDGFDTGKAHESREWQYHLPLITLTRATNAPVLSLRLPSLTLRKRMPLWGAMNATALPTKMKSSLSSPT